MTPKQLRFVDEYLIDLNATQAAIRAGYSAKKFPEIGWQLLQKTPIQAAIAEARAKLSKRTDITQERIIRELARVAFGDKRNLMTWGPDGVQMVDSTTLTDDAAAMVAEVSETRTESGGSIKMRTHDKVKALELLARHLGMFNDKLQLDVADNLADVIREARQRAGRQ